MASETDETKKKPNRIEELRTEFRGDLDRHASRLADLEKAKPPSMDRIMAMFAAQAREIEALKTQVSSLVVTRPRELEADEAEQMMRDKPGTRFLVIDGGPTNLSRGDIIDARTRFHSAQHLAQNVASGLRIAVAG